jgi:hypothetical protein
MARVGAKRQGIIIATLAIAGCTLAVIPILANTIHRQPLIAATSPLPTGRNVLGAAAIATSSATPSPTPSPSTSAGPTIRTVTSKTNVATPVNPSPHFTRVESHPTPAATPDEPYTCYAYDWSSNWWIAYEFSVVPNPNGTHTMTFLGGSGHANTTVPTSFPDMCPWNWPPDDAPKYPPPADYPLYPDQDPNPSSPVTY